MAPAADRNGAFLPKSPPPSAPNAVLEGLKQHRRRQAERQAKSAHRQRQRQLEEQYGESLDNNNNTTDGAVADGTASMPRDDDGMQEINEFWRREQDKESEEDSDYNLDDERGEDDDGKGGNDGLNDDNNNNNDRRNSMSPKRKKKRPPTKPRFSLGHKSNRKNDSARKKRRMDGKENAGNKGTFGVDKAKKLMKKMQHQTAAGLMSPSELSRVSTLPPSPAETPEALRMATRDDGENENDVAVLSPHQTPASATRNESILAVSPLEAASLEENNDDADDFLPPPPPPEDNNDLGGENDDGLGMPENDDGDVVDFGEDDNEQTKALPTHRQSTDSVVQTAERTNDDDVGAREATAAAAAAAAAAAETDSFKEQPYGYGSPASKASNRVAGDQDPDDDDDDDDDDDYNFNDDDDDDDDGSGAGFNIVSTPESAVGKKRGAVSTPLHVSSEEEDESDYSGDDGDDEEDGDDATVSDYGTPEADQKRGRKDRRRSRGDRRQSGITYSPKGIPIGHREYETVPIGQYRVSPSPDSNGLRRSRRARCKPLEFWRNERPIFGVHEETGVLGDAMGAMPVVANIVNAKGTPYKKRKNAGRGRKLGGATREAKMANMDLESQKPLDTAEIRKKRVFLDGGEAEIWDENIEEAVDKGKYSGKHPVWALSVIVPFPPSCRWLDGLVDSIACASHGH